MRPVLGVAHQRAQLVEAQRTERLVEVHLQARALAGERRRALDVVRAGAEVDAVVAAGARARGLLLGGKRRAVGQGWGVVGHVHHAREAARQRRGRPGIEVLFVRGAGIAQVHMRVNQAGQLEERHSSPSGYKKESRFCRLSFDTDMVTKACRRASGAPARQTAICVRGLTRLASLIVLTVIIK